MALRLVPPIHRATHRIGLYLAGLEQAVARRVTSADLKGFTKVVSAVEVEAHKRTRARK